MNEDDVIDPSWDGDEPKGLSPYEFMSARTPDVLVPHYTDIKFLAPECSSQDLGVVMEPLPALSIDEREAEGFGAVVAKYADGVQLRMVQQEVARIANMMNRAARDASAFGAAWRYASESGESAVAKADGVTLQERLDARRAPPVDDMSGDDVCADAEGALAYLRGW